MHVARIKTLELPEGEGSATSGTIVRFGLFCATLYLLAIGLPDSCFGPLNRVTAQMAGLLLGLFSLQVAVQGTTLTLNGFSTVIITECSGIYLALLFVSFVLSFPSSLKSKCLGLLVGIPFLTAANLVRIALVTAVGGWQPLLFPYVHVYLAQVAMVMLVCLGSLAWQRWAVSAETCDTPSQFLVRFFVVASILFVLWLPVHRSYIALLDRLVIYLFSLIDFVLFIPERPEIYHHTLSLVVFAALVAATRGIGGGRRARGLTVGLLLLVLVHLLYRVTHVLVTALQIPKALPVMVSIHYVNQYLLPVLFWVVLVRQKTVPVPHRIEEG